jgi:arsenate reductase
MIDIMETAKKKAAFICVHNSCRSQVAEVLGRLLAADVFESYSAGTAPGSGSTRMPCD